MNKSFASKREARIAAAAVLLIVTAALAPQAWGAGAPRAEVVGLRLGMSKQAVHGRLEKIGKFVREERGRQEIWTLEREPRFASVLVGYDGEYKVRYVTAIARDGGRRVRYTDVAALKSAQAENIVGHYRYTWEVKPSKKSPGYFVIVLGTDPQYLTSFSIKKHNTAPGDDDEEEEAERRRRHD